jgi:hypothetical protein
MNETTGQPAPHVEIPAVTAVARDFIEAWYAGDGDRMQSSLHPDLVKRSLFRDSKDGQLRLRRKANAAMMVGWTQEGGGSHLPEEDQTYTIHVLDIFRHIATVKVESHTYMDYLHLAKIEGSWIIVHDLWEVKDGQLSE